MGFLLEFFSTYTYLVGVLVLGLIWCLIFFKKRVNRNEMLLAGVMFGAAAVLLDIQYALYDYWHPAFLVESIPVEDFFYGFFLGGICVQIYFLFFNVKEKLVNKPHPFFVIASLFISILSFILLTGILKLNSIVAHIVPPFAIGSYISFKDHRDVKVQIWSGFFAIMVSFIAFQIMLLFNPSFVRNIWYLNNLTGILFLGIPLEEYLFAFSLGFGVSHFYEYVTGKDLILKKPKSLTFRP